MTNPISPSARTGSLLAAALLTLVTILLALLGARADDMMGKDKMAGDSMMNDTMQDKTEIAIFAGGCFWCVESDFDHVDGVLKTTSGFIGGHLKNPSYKQVSRGGTGHSEAVEITFDPGVVTFGELVELFWRSVDPTDAGGQFCDRGDSYRTGIFATSEEQMDVATASKNALNESGVLPAPVVTEIQEAGPFYPAEDYHQNYYEKNPLRYNYYRKRCGRDARVKALWGNEAWAAH